MKISKDDLSKLNSITDKRPATVIQHIIKHGYITTEELANDYGYEHAPRAARDVRERGVYLILIVLSHLMVEILLPISLEILFLWRTNY